MCLSFDESFAYQTKQRLQGVVSSIKRSTCVLHDLVLFKDIVLQMEHLHIVTLLGKNLNQN